MTGKKPNPTSTATPWEAIHQRMEQAVADLKQSMTVNPEEQKATLEKRAQKLAQKEKKEDRRESIEVVEFRLAQEQYGVECIYVREVYPLKNLTPIPGTPDFVLGIISLRGEIISVVDLKRFFEMPPKGLTDLTRVIILQHPEIDMEFGILAEEVMGTVSLAIRDLQPPPPTLTGTRGEYLKGIAKNRLILLDAAKLLSDKKIIIHQEVEI